MESRPTNDNRPVAANDNAPWPFGKTIESVMGSFRRLLDKAILLNAELERLLAEERERRIPTLGEAKKIKKVIHEFSETIEKSEQFYASIGAHTSREDIQTHMRNLATDISGVKNSLGVPQDVFEIDADIISLIDKNKT